jgi:hypothetical protein
MFTQARGTQVSQSTLVSTNPKVVKLFAAWISIYFDERAMTQEGLLSRVFIAGHYVGSRRLSPVSLSVASPPFAESTVPPFSSVRDRNLADGCHPSDSAQRADVQSHQRNSGRLSRLHDSLDAAARSRRSPLFPTPFPLLPASRGKNCRQSRCHAMRGKNRIVAFY